MMSGPPKGIYLGRGHLDGVLEIEGALVHHPDLLTSQFENNYFTEMCSGSEEGSYLRLIDFCITQL